MKKIKRKARKGFTLIELVVVIAVIAILGGVSVATYVVVMKNANLSNDQQTIKMMNDTLGQHQYSDGGKNDSVSDAVSDLYGDGFDLSAKHTYSSGYHYVYNQSKDQMVLLDGSWNAVYPDNSSVGSDTWAFYYGKGEDVSASVNNYFSFQNVLAADVNMFPSNSVIDLNGYLCNAQTQVGAISLQNGFTYTGWTKKNGCTDIVENNVANVATSSGGNTGTYTFPTVTKVTLPTEIVVDGLYVNGGTSGESAPTADVIDAYVKNKYDLTGVTDYSGYNITIQNCSFTNIYDGRLIGSGYNYNKVTFKNNTFQNGYKWSIILKSKNNETVVENNKFINCARGIDINMVAGMNTVTIKNNEMKLFNDIKSNAFQLAGVTPLANMNAISISNNKVDNANAVLTLHETLANNASLDDIKNKINLDIIKSKMKFSDNSYSNLSSSTLAVTDPDLYSHYAGANKTADVVAYFNEIVNGLGSYIQ